MFDPRFYNELMSIIRKMIQRSNVLLSISAVYTQSGTVYDTDDLDSLKDDLVVTASYDDGSSEILEASEYTLSGTLEVGTSTITVTYHGKTDTFNVTVSNSGIPENYTWLYQARNGQKLSSQDYITKTSSGTTSETLAHDALVAHVNNNGSPSSTTNVLLTFAFSDTTTTNATLTTKAKLVYCPNESSSSLAAIGQRFQLSNGTSGAQVYFEDASGKIRVVHYEGTTKKATTTVYDVGEYYIFELKLLNGHAIFSIDGTQIFDTSSLSTSYATTNQIRLHATNSTRCPNGVTTEFDWIAYYEPLE